jgi:hypothetical protein
MKEKTKKGRNEQEVIDVLTEIREELSKLNMIVSRIDPSRPQVQLSDPMGRGSVGSIGRELKRIADFLLHGSRDGTQIFDPNEDEIKEMEYEKLQIELSEMKEKFKQSKKKNEPQYIAKYPAILVDNQLVDDIAPDSNESKLCEVVLRDSETMEKEWTWDEVVEAWGDSADDHDTKVVYRTGRRINDKVAKKTDIKKFFIVTTKTIKVNPSLIVT